MDPQGVQLILTCDNGWFEAIEWAMQAGVVIVDHHEVQATLPSACLVHPRHPQGHPLPDLVSRCPEAGLTALLGRSTNGVSGIIIGDGQ